jgi:hypothetical protein
VAAATGKENLVLELFLCVRRWLSQPLRRGDRGATAVEYGLVIA